MRPAAQAVHAEHAGLAMHGPGLKKPGAQGGHVTFGCFELLDFDTAVSPRSNEVAQMEVDIIPPSESRLALVVVYLKVVAMSLMTVKFAGGDVEKMLGEVIAMTDSEAEARPTVAKL